MDFKDYYKILGVDRNADEKTIKQAYRRLARESHPDKHPGDKQAEERFKEINEAYQVIGDPEKRKKYDQFGASWRQFERAGGAPGGFDWSQWAHASPGSAGPGGVRVEYGDLNELFGRGGEFSDFFETLFGQATPGTGARRRAAPRMRGQDVEQPVEVTLEEAARGAQRLVEVNGRRLEIRIPPGVRTGSKVRIARAGQPGHGGEPGDLMLRVTVLPHERFQRHGDELETTVPLNLYDAVFGGEVPVPTLDGQVLLKIPPETSGARAFRLRGRGMPRQGDSGQRGDLIVHFQIQVPESLTEKEKELFRQLAELRGKSV